MRRLACAVSLAAPRRLLSSAAALSEHHQRFARLSESDVQHFKSIDPTMVVDDPDALQTLSTDWMRKYGGRASLALRPASTADAAAVLRYCNERRLAVVPQGGNTGLVGGGVPVFDEIVLSTQRLNRILALDAVSNTVSLQSGVILASLEEELEKHGMALPIDLGAKGSCHVGGNVATNAGGVHLLRYGNLHGSVLGIEAVLADGTVLDLMNTLRKDNTGYDLKQMFIGSEGTLGLITGVVLAVPPLPASRQVAFLGCETFEQVLQTLQAAKESLGEVLSAFEFLDSTIMALCQKNLQGVRHPLAQDCNFYCLVEAAGSNAEHDAEKLAVFAERVLGDSIVQDGTIAQDGAQMERIWAIREGAPEALMPEGDRYYKYDLSLPLDSYYSIVEETRARVGDKGVVVGYGHVGDCNVHLNVATKATHDEIYPALEPFIWDRVKQSRGSISAEHGVGLQKVKKMHYAKSEAALKLMRSMKQMMDPHGILNPYKVIEAEPERAGA